LKKRSLRSEVEKKKKKQLAGPTQNAARNGVVEKVRGFLPNDKGASPGEAAERAEDVDNVDLGEERTIIGRGK